ncbi:curved DNA-binding protein [Prosthecobacter debontii]|uniref:Curved DNA-binding protein n=1 Tax=Prosthecobacter debontii TaxID=48467 RepID=A0A1T4Z3H2_9BACT|nr:J domain-containing protein [Prosthecobacter debontii]SKB08413.1 curved DNA-binding protein [Prosthecobacter debontii]
MSVEFQDYYATLGLSREASEDEIKKAFRKLARQYHPDVAQDKPAAEAKFKEINEAYEVLSDPEKRKKYDLLGAHWRDAENGMPPPPPRQSRRRAQAGVPEPEFHFGGTGFSDFFEQYFSGGTRYGFPEDDPGGFQYSYTQGGQPRARRGSDIEGDILVTLHEAMHGTVRPISMQSVNPQTGQVETTEFQVRIPPGATDGRRIRVPGHGEPGQGGAPAGDLFLRVRHATHPNFSSREADIYYELDIAPWEAVLGAEIVVPTLDGSIKLRIPAGAENGQKLRAKNRGLPKGKTGERGDFYVVLNVQLPTTLSSEERTLWENLRATSSFRPRAS